MFFDDSTPLPILVWSYFLVALSFSWFIYKLFVWYDLIKKFDRQRVILSDFYESTVGNEWKQKRNWCSKRGIGRWEGIEVSYAGDIIKIDLPINNLRGNFYAIQETPP